MWEKMIVVAEGCCRKDDCSPKVWRVEKHIRNNKRKLQQRLEE